MHSSPSSWDASTASSSSSDMSTHSSSFMEQRHIAELMQKVTDASDDFVLEFKQFQHSFSVPACLSRLTSSTVADYHWHLSSSPSESLETTSDAELFFRYIDFVANKIVSTSDDFAHLCRALLRRAESELLQGNDIHSFVANIKGEDSNKRRILRSFYDSSIHSDFHISPCQAALFDTNSGATIVTIFGGQGNTDQYFGELRDVCTTYHSLLGAIPQQASDVLASLLQDYNIADVYPGGLNFLKWLEESEAVPDNEYILSAPVSFPLIGLLQLLNYVVICKILEKTPGELLGHVKGTTGHSQGIVVAAMLSTAGTWEDFPRVLKSTLSILFYIGCRSQQNCPSILPPLHVVRESIEVAAGNPSSMLNIQGLTMGQVERQLNLTNGHLASHERLSVALINGSRNFVISGSPSALHGFNMRLQSLKAGDGAKKSNSTPTNTTPRLTTKFLPISAPFHGPYLEKANELLASDFERLSIRLAQADLKIPVYHTHSGRNLQNGGGSEDISLELAKMITIQQVNWPLGLSSGNATHFLDFGPGGSSGVGVLVQRLVEGRGSRVILASTLSSPLSSVGFMSEIFQSSPPKFSDDWSKHYAPSLIRDAAGKFLIRTKMSELLGLPPIMVAGMTPTTTHPDFVAAAMNAGYHIEFATGSYHDAKSLTDALITLENMAPIGRGITLNLIYANPRAIQWQIPLLQSLREAGHLITGMTLGAGVPSKEIVADYIQTLGLQHLGFKPGSVDSIQEVVEIAKAFPSFPIILQWTGGRGGGHHSTEDMHGPIVQTYAAIRSCQNLILVAGSGFGGVEDTWPYVTGAWARAYDSPDMPFDGVLFGSRMMVAKEAHTSPAAKMAIANAPGTENGRWHETYTRPTGGILTVTSEMGQPIHKIATRGVELWHELDKTIFSLDRAKQLPELQRRRTYIINRLNSDFQKVWFGRKESGEVVDVKDMTYLEVLKRLIQLLYLKKQERWIDDSYIHIVCDFVCRIEERMTESSASMEKFVFGAVESLADPGFVLEKISSTYRAVHEQLISGEDELFLLSICRRRGQKPPPFILILDESFETSFKKDSLWQSEDLEAVFDEDVQRTCILQGPVAAKFSTVENIDQPVKKILDDVSLAYVDLLLAGIESVEAIPTVDYLETVTTSSLEALYCKKTERAFTTVFRIDEAGPLPSEDEWFSALGGSHASRRRALFTSQRVIQYRKAVSNPIRRVFRPRYGLEVEVFEPQDSKEFMISLRDGSSHSERVKISIGIWNEIVVSLVHEVSAYGQPTSLDFRFSYHPETPHALIHEIMDNRNERVKSFYERLWLGRDSQPAENTLPILERVFDHKSIVINEYLIKTFARAVGNKTESFVTRGKTPLNAPLDFAIVVGWESIMEALLSVSGDLLRLVHLSNSFICLPGFRAFKSGDRLECRSRVNSILVQNSGKQVEVRCTILQDGVARIEVVSQFLYRGEENDFSSSFQCVQEPVYELDLDSLTKVKLLLSRDWFSPLGKDFQNRALGHKVSFQLETVQNIDSKTTYSHLRTRGRVFINDSRLKNPVEAGIVQFRASNGMLSHNAVVEYLKRHGTIVSDTIPLKSSVPLSSEPLEFTAPLCNDEYAKVSRDFNPIHVSAIFAAYADLPGTITHGMHTSAIVRAICERYGVENDGIGHMRQFTASFCGMVQPGDRISIDIKHTAMRRGNRVLEVIATNLATEDKVLAAECEIEQAPTAYIFTGQGSQSIGMGMDLYATSSTARSIWDRADRFFDDTYGKRISDSSHSSKTC